MSKPTTRTSLALAPIACRTSLRWRLQHGVSVSALLVAGALAPTPVTAGAFRSLSQALAAQSGAAATAAAAAAGGTVTAARQAALGAQNLATAAARFSSLSQALASAAAAATAANAAVPDGIGAGGLDPATGSPSDWIGAGSPTQTTASGRYTVSVKQTQQLAELTWKTFNVGARTTLNFDQSAGGGSASSWVVINTVTDPNANGSLILGSITAPGKVYVLNRNGIAFGAGAKVNVGSLVAATADIAQTQFGANAQGQATFNLYGAQSGNSFLPTFVNGVATAGVTVDAGAVIQTPSPASASAGGGYVMLLGGTVQNAGDIATPVGQTVLASGTGFTLRQGYSATGNATSTTLGSEVAVTGGGAALNTGVILADQGDITMVGHDITQDGVLLATTTVNIRGTIHLLTDTTDHTAQITLGNGSATEILPEDNGQTALDSQRAADIATSATLNAQRLSSSGPQLNDRSNLPDQFGESRIEISSGGSVDFAPGAVAITPGGQVAVGAYAQVLIESGAAIDVAGSTNALLPMSLNDLLVNVQPYQLRDSPANRTGALVNSNVYVDARTLVEIPSGAYAGNIYTPGGLLEVSGYLGLVPHGITEWTAIGGQVTLQANGTATTTSGTTTTISDLGSVIAEAGSVINLQGGLVTYQAGFVNASYVQASNGEIFNVNDAPNNLTYTGVYNGVTVAHPRWQVTDTFNNPVLTPSTIYEPSYVVGRDAGSLTINSPTVQLAGDIAAGFTYGQYQDAARPVFITDPYLLAQNVVPLAGALGIGEYTAGLLTNGYASAVSILSTPGTLSALVPGAPLPAGVADTVVLDSIELSHADFANLGVTTTGDIAVDAPIAVANGGTVSLNGATIEIAGNISARGGAIDLANYIEVASPSGLQPILLAPAGGGSITLDAGATLDARGIWTNAVLDPAHLAGLGFANGGTVTLASIGALDIGAGSAIDVSSGGGYLSGGKLVQASGGSVAITGDFSPTGTQGTLALAIGGTFAGYGVAGGGTLSVTAPEILLGGPATSSTGSNVVSLAGSVFGSGFADYAVNGVTSVEVASGSPVTVTRPVYLPADPASLASDANPAAAYTLTLPTLYAPVKGTDTFVQRAGASLSISSSINPSLPNGGGGSVTVDDGALVAVDPKQSIALAAYGQVTVLGTVTALSGSIAVVNTSFESQSSTFFSPTTYVPGISVWIGSTAVLDVSGATVLLFDPLGRSFGAAGSGGTITLGSVGGTISLAGTTQPISTDAQVVVRPGALVEASGAAVAVSAVPNVVTGALHPGTTPTLLVGGGGTIAARSYNGIALDGTIIAAAGGPGAAGGTLLLREDGLNFGHLTNVPATLEVPREILVSQDAVPALNDPTLQPGDPLPASSLGIARISQAQITTGGFDAVTLFASDAIAFDGSVNLSAGRSISLEQGPISDTTLGASVAIAAPYVLLSGYDTTNNAFGATPQYKFQPVSSPGSLTVSADLIDLQYEVLFGTDSPVVPINGGSTTGINFANEYGFADISLLSTGDIRFLGGANGVSPVAGSLRTAANLTLQAAQLYPVTGAEMYITAGINYYAAAGTNQLAGGTLTILGLGAAAPAIPYSVGGTLTFSADTVVQDGIVRAPEGVLGFGYLAAGSGSQSGLPTLPANLSTSVTFGPGSLSSVSLDGATIPYGGTVDGVNYTYAGAAIPVLAPTVAIEAQSVAAAAGAKLDISGGGTLSGAGFITGRGGSADVLKTPLLTSVNGTIAAGATDPVYAILPGYASDYAPTAPGDAGYAVPGLGQQITVGSEVPGLPAGTYTLLPAYYALLPGGFRVELTGGTIVNGAAAANGNFSVLAGVTTSIANAGIVAPTQTAALFTSGPNLRNLSQYNEESYSSFETAQAALFGAPRPFLPQDGKTLLITYPSVASTLTALSFAPGVLLDSPAPGGGYGGTVEIDGGKSGIAVTGSPYVLPPVGFVSLDAATLDSLNAPRLVLGGTLTSLASSPNIIGVTSNVLAVDILPGANLAAGEVLLTAGQGLTPGTINVEGATTVSVNGAPTTIPGATISTLGEVPAAFDIGSGYYFNDAGFLVLDVSNGHQVFTPFTASAGLYGNLSVGSGASLLAGGSLQFQIGDGSSNIGSATFGGKYIGLETTALNIGSTTELASLSGQLPPGLDLTDTVFTALLTGDAAAGIPAAQQLTLTATEETNFFGSVALDGPQTSLVLNTPAIYGYNFSTGGAPADVAAVNVASFTWSGIAGRTVVPGSATLGASLTPGAQVAITGSSNLGSLTIDAATITLGVGPNTQPDGQTQLDRLAVGFSDVSLTASTSITANNQSSLSVYQTQPVFGTPGSGGNLTFASPLITSSSAAILNVTAGGALTLSGAAAANTGAVTTLGGEINFVAQSITDATAVALPAGRLTLTATDNIALENGATIDLSGRSTPIFDQTAQSRGGSLVIDSQSGGVTEATGALINVSAPDAAAGSVAISALAGTVALDGTIDGSATGSNTAGSFSVLANTLPSFDALNTLLDAGGVFGARTFEVASGNITVDQTVRAQTISIAADAGSIDVVGTIDATGTHPGNISLSAGQNLTLAGTAVLDAQATSTAKDSYGVEINAENRANVALTTAHGTLTLSPGATINVSYPDAANPQGRIALNAPRSGTNDILINASGALNITGAQTIQLAAFRTYAPTDPNGTIEQNIDPTIPGMVSLQQINTDNLAFMAAVPGNADLTARLAGLAAYGKVFNLIPGVEIDSSTQSGGNLTIQGDLNLSTLRYSDVGYGIAVNPSVAGSGEPGSLVFRAANNLYVNGSVSDGFLPPPIDGAPNTLLPDDTGWFVFGGGFTPEPFNADVILPASLSVPGKAKGSFTNQVELGAFTTFDNSRAISLNYPITIYSTPLQSGVAIPIPFTLGNTFKAPTGGFVTTAQITSPDGSITPKGTFLAAGTSILAGSVMATGTVLPNTGLSITCADNTVVTAGTPLNIFASTLTLSSNTAPLPAEALIPSNTSAYFVSTAGKSVNTLNTRPTAANGTQGLVYPIAQMLPAGSLSWNMDFTAGANLGAASPLAVQPTTAIAAGPDTGNLTLADQHYVTAAGKSSFQVLPSFSVIRTGTGDLSLVAGGNFDQSSLYGIYTAGTQAPLGNGQDAQFNTPPALQSPSSGTPLGSSKKYVGYNDIILNDYQSYYPTGGGNLLLSAQGNLTSDIVGTSFLGSNPSDLVGNWLWTQGSTQIGQPSAWWINFGSYTLGYNPDGSINSSITPQLVGFEGIGTLGGGNATIIAGGNAGESTDRSGAGAGTAPRGEGLTLAVASTGRLLPGSTAPVLTGGGELTVEVSGSLNPNPLPQNSTETLSLGSATDLRGAISISAGAIGVTYPIYGVTTNFGTATNDPRVLDPFAPTNDLAAGGLIVVPGDSTAELYTMRDLVLAGASDPGRQVEQYQTSIPTGQPGVYASGQTGFSLWSSTTSISLFAAGGNLTPSTQFTSTQADPVTGYLNNFLATDFRFVYPPTLLATAASGNIAYGFRTSNTVDFGTTAALETAPSPTGQVAFLAGGSIFANGETIDISGASPTLISLPTDPAFREQSTLALGGFYSSVLTNVLTGYGTYQQPVALFALQPDTPTSDVHANDPQPALFYAGTGDIVNFQTGETISYGDQTNEQQRQWYIAAKPVWIIAGNDIVSSGTRPSGQNPGSQNFADEFAIQPNQRPLVGIANGGYNTTSGNLFLNTGATSTSVVSAGRDILSSYFYVGGPGLLEVDAGRNLYQASYVQPGAAGTQVLDFGAIKSLGSLISGAPISLTGGASIATLAGIGSTPDYTVFADTYLNPANQANLALPLTDPSNAGKVQQVYTPQLVAYLAANYGYTGGESGALAFFQALPAVDQNVFLREIFYEELLAGGREYTDPTSRFYKSYARGQLAIDLLFLPQVQVAEWLAQQYQATGNTAYQFSGTGSPLPVFAALTPTQQAPFVADIFTADEIPLSTALDFPGYPTQTAKLPGVPTGYTGAVTMYSGTVAPPNQAILQDINGNPATFDAGITTLFGGNVQVLDPGGSVLLGISGGPAPGPGSGILTEGTGNIDIFSLGSVILGKSRIFTTAGGNIQIWSADGDINAGIGANTTVVYNPPLISYDNTGGIVETPSAPTNGAGIATLAPLPGIPAGNIDLATPFGVIDTGEAGIRSSGTLTVAGQVVGSGQVTAAGGTVGTPTVSVASLGAVQAASSAAGAAASTAQNNATRTAAPVDQPSVVDVEVLSIGGGSGDDSKKKRL